ncbi:Serine/threonine-protein kinase 16 [Phytophthora boehmeriae]|uniref:Serine/threonine-protein kinase 16 n=1 Tax=Phytophthora boehmeriae TaxID=109152 RepID=A0A8T1W1H5_9STRA|nr:Serine/threonine-protein kinase 16 [Phytophthora boehmeriae]
MASHEKESFLPLAVARGATSSRICSAVTLFPFYAAQRVLSCLGYSQSVRMQSGRLVVISSEIAQGGFSFVYKVRDTDTGEAFALKKILCQTNEQVQLAKAEIQAHKSFSHPNIMPLSDYAVVSQEAETFEYYLLYPFMENGTLRDMINDAISQDVRLPEAQILNMFLDICRGVAELHSKSPPLAHRDIKPENIMLSDEGEPLLTDFGSISLADVAITKRSDALLLQEHSAQHSSMAYRAPELYDVPDNTHISSATDVWSLGCLLYAMAFGYSPFECSFYDSGVVRVVECTYLAVIGPIKFPRNCAYSSKFCELIKWILTQDGAMRPSVFDVIEQLHDFNNNNT